MNELKKITNLVKEELVKFQINYEIDARFSNFNKNTDVQINDLIKIKKDDNFNEIVNSIKEKFKNSTFIESFEIVDSGFINIKLSSTFLEESLQNHKKNILKKAIFYKMDIYDKKKLEKIFLKKNFDVVFHFAAFINNEESIKFPKRYYKNNYLKMFH